MLYRTDNPFIIPFNPLCSNPIPPHPPLPASLPLSFSPPSSQAKEEMECLEATAMKSCLRPEMGFLKPQVILEDTLSVGADDFSVDDLLDFSHEETENGFQVNKEEDEEREENAIIKSSLTNSTTHTLSTLKHDFDSLPSSELPVPAEDLASLEWLSRFVEDSEFPVGYATGKETVEKKTGEKELVEPEPEPEKASLTTPVQTRARSKRTRSGGRVWSLGPTSVNESSSTSSTSSSSSPTTSSWLIFTSTCPNMEPPFPVEPKPPILKKQKKRKSVTEVSCPGGGSNHPTQQRRCSHCGVQRTPQWRAGPLGAKTLCNACGVRFKSGRLLPEYRPACSPTFSSELHSNNHRKVLEMRKKKELAGIEPGLTPVVPSF
ncbi:Zinc finger, GATA-type [Dillenia turbinata]|uniref:Zinc finger, GATA-type n=1 Tax=Dillenia turbinata TaxID=194707 RepID=A0AAN8UXK4_9MAGN